MDDRERNGMRPDDFWDIESLIPSKKEPKREARLPSFDVSSVEVEAPANKNEEKIFSGSSFTRFIPPHNAREIEEEPEPELEYEPEQSLIHHVKVFSLRNKYNFYERFLDDAKRLMDVKGEPCPPVPFFSYTPQYSQLNRAQLSYYLWWRENVRSSVYPEADYSYVLLYLYELINLSPCRDKQYTLDEMCEIWLHYGKEHPFVAKYLGEWICDFCLINRLAVPSKRLRPLYPDIMKNCLIKEFYVVGSEDKNGIGSVCADALVEIASAYDYRKSKYATEDRLPYMKKHLVGAVDAVLSNDSENGDIFGGMKHNMADNSAVRTAFSGALCSVSVRKRIEIEYYSFSRSYELRYLISDIMKYSENKLRRLWGIKSRLNIYALPTPIKKCVDKYFESIMPSSVGAENNRQKSSEENNEYEKFYEAPKSKLSTENAAKIEESSWETTKILIETFEDEVAEPPLLSVPNDTIKHEKTSIKSTENDLSGALGPRLDFLLAVLDGAVIEQHRIASELVSPAEVIVDEINELAADFLGDILIEGDDGDYTVIEDYRELVRDLKNESE